jgi:hypothetical protein
MFNYITNKLSNGTPVELNSTHLTKKDNHTEQKHTIENQVKGFTEKWKNWCNKKFNKTMNPPIRAELKYSSNGVYLNYLKFLYYQYGKINGLELLLYTIIMNGDIKTLLRIRKEINLTLKMIQQTNGKQEELNMSSIIQKFTINTQMNVLLTSLIKYILTKEIMEDTPVGITVNNGNQQKRLRHHIDSLISQIKCNLGILTVNTECIILFAEQAIILFFVDNIITFMDLNVDNELMDDPAKILIWCLNEYGFICENTKVSFIFASTVCKGNGDALFSIMMNTVVIPRMCGFTECRCVSKEYGEELQDLKVKLNMNHHNDHIFSTYGKCQGAISHVWGEQLILNDDWVKLVKTSLTKNPGNQHSLWLDVVQKEQFNDMKCRKEYEGKDVYVLTKVSMLIGKYVQPKTLYALLAMSDWGNRGWIAQEVMLAGRLIIVEANGEHIIIERNSWKSGRLIKAILGDFDLDIEITIKFTLLSKRIWRYQEDILLSADWWSNNSISFKDEELPAWILNSIFFGERQTKNTRNTYCWLPITSVGNMPTVVGNARHQNGILTANLKGWVIDSIEPILNRQAGENTPILKQIFTYETNMKKKYNNIKILIVFGDWTIDNKANDKQQQLWIQGKVSVNAVIGDPIKNIGHIIERPQVFNVGPGNYKFWNTKTTMNTIRLAGKNIN